MIKNDFKNKMFVKIKNKASVKIGNSNDGILFPGERMLVEVDKQGTPVKRYWRNRFRDSKIDNSIEIIKDSKSKTKEK